MEIDRKKDMKRKFDETSAISYTEARSLVFNISLGKLHSHSPKPVEPSLWRSLLIAKTLNRIAEELKIEADGANEPAAEDKAAGEVLENQRLDALFLLRGPPVAVSLSKPEDGSPVRLTFDDSAMQTDDSAEQTSLLMLGKRVPPNSDTASALVPFRIGAQSSAVVVAAAEDSPVRDDFDEIDCACLESFQSSDLSDISVSLEQDFLLGCQPSPLNFSAFRSSYEDFQDFGSISEFDCLMQVLEEECV